MIKAVGRHYSGDMRPRGRASCASSYLRRGEVCALGSGAGNEGLVVVGAGLASGEVGVELVLGIGSVGGG